MSDITNNSSSANSSVGSGSSKKKNKSRRGVIIFLIIIIVLLLGAGAGMYFWQKDQINSANNTIEELNGKLSDSQKKLDEALKTNNKSAGQDASGSVSKRPSAATIENIESAITSGNTAALEGYMAPSVNVIIAASEGMGARTPAEAVTDLKYISKATDPWHFNVDNNTLAKFAKGDYKEYFNSTTLVGISANNMVIAFNFDSNGKINGIFMASNSTLL